MGEAIIAGRKRRRGHLVEHGLKEVVILPVDERDPDRCVRQTLGGVQPGEPAADDDHPRLSALEQPPAPAGEAKHILDRGNGRSSP